jgi:hypothetical protein
VEELLAALLYGIFELFAEVVLEVLCEAGFSALLRFIRGVFSEWEFESPIFAGFSYFLFGVVAGIASFFLFPHPLIHPSRFRGISLLISPLATGLIMSQIGMFLRRRSKRTVRIESFLYGFAFAFGMTVIRLISVK